MSDTARAFEKAARAMHACERRIASLTQWGRPAADSVDGRILAALEAKRDRERPAYLALRDRAESARRTDAVVTSGDFPIATRKTVARPEDWPDIPDFLRRAKP